MDIYLTVFIVVIIKLIFHPNTLNPCHTEYYLFNYFFFRTTNQISSLQFFLTTASVNLKSDILSHFGLIFSRSLHFHEVDPKTGLVDYDNLEKMAKVFCPKVIIGGASAYPRDWDWKRLREVIFFWTDEFSISIFSRNFLCGEFLLFLDM